MDESPLLHELAALAREEEAREAALLDERWDRLARGELSAAEAERLAAEASDPEEGERRLAAFRPLGSAFHERVSAAVLAQGAAAPDASFAKRRLPAVAKPRRRTSLEPPHRPGVLRRLGWRGLVAAAALAGAALLLPRFLTPPFPAYELARIPEGEARERSLDAPANAEPALFRPGTAFEVAVRPLTAIDDLHGALEVRCLLRSGDRVRPWSGCAEQAEIAPTQAVRISGTIGRELALEPGLWTLWIVVGRQGRIANLERRPAVLRGDGVAKHDWIALRVPKPLRMEPSP